MNPTDKVVLLVLFALVLWETWTLVNKRQKDTISESWWRLVYKRPLVSFAMGMLMGHWVWIPERCWEAVAAEKASVELRVSPRMGFAPLSVLGRLTFKDPQREIGCPEFWWEWPTGKGSRQSDCDPEDPERPVEWSDSRRFRFGPGEHEIKAWVETPVGRRGAPPVTVTVVQ